METVFSATHLASMCLDCGERENSEIIQELRKVHSSVARQSQTLFLPVVEVNKYYSSFQLSYVVSVYLFELCLACHVLFVF
jgi:hypothetical protein